MEWPGKRGFPHWPLGFLPPRDAVDGMILLILSYRLFVVVEIVNLLVHVQPMVFCAKAVCLCPS